MKVCDVPCAVLRGFRTLMNVSCNNVQTHGINKGRNSPSVETSIFLTGVHFNKELVFLEAVATTTSLF